MFENVIIRKITLCILALLLFMPFSYANELEVAQRKLKKKSLTLYKDTAGYKVFTAKSGGFCIVKGQHVYAYSNSGEEQNLDLEILSYPQNKNLISHKQKYDTIAPLLSKTKFNQQGPYNNALPQVHGERCITGCVPVAVAQVMKYYNYPPVTFTDIPSCTTKTFGLKLDSISKLTVIDWKNIEPSYSSKKNKLKEDAVANLMKIICTSACTDLTPDASPTYYRNAYKALIDYLGYDKNIRVIEYDDYRKSKYEEIVYNELALKRPVMLSSHSHQFVCDGYEDGLFHANWGWGGMFDGYFDLSMLALNRSSKDSIYYLDAALGVVPDTAKVVKHSITTNFRLSQFHPNYIPDALSSAGELKGSIICSFFSIIYNEVKTHVNIGYSDKNGKWVLIGDNPFCLVHGCGDVIRFTCRLKNNSTYRIVPLEKCDGKDWEPIAGSDCKYLDLVVENGKVKVLLPQKYVIKADASFVDQEDGKYVKLDLSNSGYEDFCDSFYVKLNDLDEYLAKQELFVPANGNTSVMYKYADSTLLSKYEVKVFDANQSLLAVAKSAPNKIEDIVIAENASAQDSATVDEVTEKSEPIDPEALSVTGIALGLMLVVLLFIFIKIFG